MHIRPATPSDFPSTASLSVPCFWNDELYEYTNPYREQYPDHFRSLFLRRHKLRFVTPGFVLYVAVTDDGDDGHEGVEGRVVGFAVWERRGTSEAAMRWRRDSWWNLLERTLFTAQESYVSLLRLDKSLDPVRFRRLLTEAIPDFQSIPEIWKLQKLGTHPAFQRRGVASLLLDWGKLQAEREGVPIGLESSLLARPLYSKSGFRWVGNIRVKGFTFEDVPVLLWEPRGKEGCWSVKGDGYHGSEKV